MSAFMSLEQRNIEAFQNMKKGPRTPVVKHCIGMDGDTDKIVAGANFCLIYYIFIVYDVSPYRS